ncbi:MFS general substrate transporter [Agrocybe pediades]|nr:MFS general substrate transporter [Agrocybe pediades]
MVNYSLTQRLLDSMQHMKKTWFQLQESMHQDQLPPPIPLGHDTPRDRDDATLITPSTGQHASVHSHSTTQDRSQYDDVDTNSEDRINNGPTWRAESNRSRSLMDERHESNHHQKGPKDNLNLNHNDEALDITRRNEQATLYEANEDPEIIWVNWDGKDDRKNPKNWSYKKKWTTTLVVSAFTFISPVSSSMVAPASNQIAMQFGITSTALISMTTSIFVLGYAFGPLFLGPLSEIFGRSRVFQLSNLFFMAWNLGCGFAQNRKQLIGFRFVAGLGGSAPLAVGGGILGDMWAPEERGRAIAIYSLAPLLGPVVGPVCGGWIAERSTWRWVFWSTSIVDVGIQMLGLLFLRETYAPRLLEEKAVRIRKDLDSDPEKAASDSAGKSKTVKTIYDVGNDRSWKAVFSKALTRPFMLFYHETIIQLLGIYMAFVYGIFYLFLVTIPLMFREIYHQRPGIQGLNYIALGIGLTLASQANARAMDRIYKHFKAKNGGKGEPEFRIPSLFPGTLLLPFGLLLTGWSAQNRLHWIAADFGIGCVGCGLVLIFQSIQTYVIDSFTLYAASALAAVSFLRSLAGFGFPLFAPAMYHKLGYGKGDTILACLAIGLGCPAPFLLWIYGKRIRMNSKYGRKSAVHRDSVMDARTEQPKEKITRQESTPMDLERAQTHTDASSNL